MSLTSSLQRIVQAKADIKSAIEAKGVTVGDNVSIVDYDDYIAQITGGGGGGSFTLEVPLPTDITLTEDYILKWEAPTDLSILGDLLNYNPVLVGYRVNALSTAGGDKILTTSTELRLSANANYIKSTISIYCIFAFGNDYATETITKPYEATTISTNYPVPFRTGTAATVGDNIYIFGGRSASGALNTIYRFDTTTNTLTLLNVTLPSVNYAAAAVTCGTDIYILGGYGTAYYNTILKFDTTNETISTLATSLPAACSNLTTICIGTDIYFAGGLGWNTTNTIYKFDTISNTITSVLTSSAFGSLTFYFVKEYNETSYFYIVSKTSTLAPGSYPNDTTMFVHRFSTTNNSLTQGVLYIPKYEVEQITENNQFVVYWDTTIPSQTYNSNRLLKTWGLAGSSIFDQMRFCYIPQPYYPSGGYVNIGSAVKTIRTTFATHGNDVYVFSGETTYNSTPYSSKIIKLSVNV